MAGQGAEMRLLRLSRLSIAELQRLAEGVSLRDTFQREITELIDQAAADRLKLADRFLTMGDALMRSRQRLWRAATARYYYAMYHSMRAVALQHHRGDDFQSHTLLHEKGVPKDFPNQLVRINELKDARVRRNEADYDPYPSSETYFRTSARNLAAVAPAFLLESRQYLRSKGNRSA